ncbi:MAG: hypothetical protein IKC10_06340 [Alphaproteobacteria bacterium]|nr:hypothetical protein [Alphaproteobacteria bacterium]
MADILTNLRELSVAFPFFSNLPIDKLTPTYFTSLCEDNIKNFDLKTTKISNDTKFFSATEFQTIQNGMFLGNQIKNKLHIGTSNNKIIWCGNEKNNLIDLQINQHSLSLKENSYILKNIGLYQLLNFITNSNTFNRGLHIFKQFSPIEFEKWFNTSIKELSKLGDFNYVSDKGYFSKASIKNKELILNFNGFINKLQNIDSIKYDEFERQTVASTREKVYSKWLKELPIDSEYHKCKVSCAVSAGNNLLDFIKNNIVETSPSILNFFNLEDFVYIYAKYDGKNVNIFRVPSRKEIDFNNFKISNVEISVPNSQLNLKTTITNVKKHTSCTLRNEIRYSHGQLNGTPEAKLYFDSGDGLEHLVYDQL